MHENKPFKSHENAPITVHLTWIQGEHAVREVNIHVKAMPLTLGGSTNTGGADYELSKHLKLLLHTNMNTTYLALTCASTATNTHI